MRYSSLLLLPLLFSTSLLRAQGGPPGADVSDLIVSADNASVLYAATASGVYRSKNGGDLWSQMNEGLPALPNVRRIGGNSQVLYAASRTDGVFRWRQDGPWQDVSTGLDGEDVLSIAMAPDNTNTVYVGTASGKIFKSTSGGDAWTSMSQGLAEGGYTEIEIAPYDSQLIFAANVSSQSPTGRVFRSINGGAEWVQKISATAVFTSFAFSTITHGIVWVGTSLGVLASADSGGSFTGPALPNFSVLDLSVDPNDEKVVYVGTSTGSALKTTDSGANWSIIPTGLPRASVNRIIAVPGTVYAGLGGSGVFRSLDGGANWRFSSSGIQAATILSVAPDPLSNAVLGSTTGGGLFRSPAAGAFWGESRNGFSSFQAVVIQYDPQTPGLVYAGTINPNRSSDGTLLRSTDGGATWEALQTGFPIYAIAPHPTDGQTVYVGTSTDRFGLGSSGLLRSSDRGATFTSFSQFAFLDVLDIQIDPANPRNLYLIARDPFPPVGYLVASTADGGSTWQSSGEVSTLLTSLAIDPANPARVVLGTGAGVYVSTDRGKTFTGLTAGLPDAANLFVNSVAADRNAQGTFYLSTTAGLFKSTDSGANWTTLAVGIDGSLAGELRVDPKMPGTLYLATSGAGVYKSTDAGTTWSPTGGSPTITAAGIVNAASYLGTGVAPGEIVSLFTLTAGPAQGVQAAFDPATGKLPVSLGGVQVFFNDMPAPLFFVRADQLNVQVPFEVAGAASVDVRVEYQGVASDIVRVPVKVTDPGVFAAVLNQNSTVNTQNTPAAPGSVIQLFATGQGKVTPDLATGAPAPGAEPFARPAAQVRVLANGTPATVYFAGLTPGLVGLLQINAELPAGVTGRVELQVFIGDNESPTKAVVFVQ